MSHIILLVHADLLELKIFKTILDMHVIRSKTNHEMDQAEQNDSAGKVGHIVAGGCLVREDAELRQRGSADGQRRVTAR